MTDGVRGVLTSTFVASALFVLLLLAPLIFANIVDQGELDNFFSVGGTSDEVIMGIEKTSDIGSHSISEPFPTQTVQGDWQIQCDSIAVTSITEAVTSTVTNATTNLTFFGESYASLVTDYRGKSPDTNLFTGPDADGIAPIGPPFDSCRIRFAMNVTVEDMEGAQGLNFVLHEDENVTYIAATLAIFSFEASGSGIASQSIHHFDKPYSTGTLLSFPITTLDGLLAKGTFANLDPTDDLVMEVILYADVSVMPKEGEVLVWDMELTKSRTGVLDNEGKIIAFNIGYVLIGGLLVVVATPFVKWTDIFGGFGGRRSARRDRRGIGTTMGGIIVALIIILALIFFFGGGSFRGLFTFALLPTSLAIAAVALVAMTTRGRTNPAFVWIMAGIAGLLGFLVGQSIQNNWIPYDALYVGAFVDVITGNISGVSAFAITAFFVVVVQIAGTIVLLFNAVQTITTDDQVSLVQ